MKNTIFLLLLFMSINSFSQEIKVGIFNDKNVKKVLLEAPKGSYKVQIDGKKKYKLKGTRSILLSVSGETINMSTGKKEYNNIKELSFSGKNKSAISVKLISPKQKARTYSGSLQVIAQKSSMKLINLPPFKTYLAGVVEAESGTKAAKEYYKNQAVICRTYALQKWDRHKVEGFNLCDGVHCQAYKGLATQSALIKKSVKKTKGLVILDENNQLIAALFSANCGGQTNNSEMVWSSKIPYLRSVKDPYCIDQRQAKWEKSISVTEFKSFLNSKGIKTDQLKAADFAFKQPVRKKYYTLNNQKIKLTSIRFGLHLRSTFFEIEPDGNKLLFHGRGYGHGVGMCQEGAMNMANKGKSYKEIINFYYTGVKIKPMAKAE